MKKITLLVLLLQLVFCDLTYPNPLDFRFEFNGNGGRAVGNITVDSDYLHNPGTSVLTANNGLLSYTMTSTTSSGELFTSSLDDNIQIIIDTGGATLDFSKELVGQPTASRVWGTIPAVISDENGNFGILSTIPEYVCYASSFYPCSLWYYDLTYKTFGGTLISLSPPFSPTTGSIIYGSVIDQSTGLGISDAIVTLNTGITTTTSIDGSYYFENLPANTYSINANKLGFQDISRSNLIVTTTTSAIADILLPKNGVLNITSLMLPSATTGEAYTGRVMVAGGTAPYTFSKAYGSLPSGLSLDTNTGSISGVPIGTGSYTFAIGVTDSLKAYSEVEYTIDFVPTLQITTDSLPFTSFPDPNYQATINAEGGKGNLSFSLVSGALPYSLVLNSHGIISTYLDGIPLQPPPGTLLTWNYGFIVKVTDSTGRTAQKALTINSAPLLGVSGQIYTGIVNSSYSSNFTATGGYGPTTWTISNGTLPDGIMLNPSKGTLSGQTSKAGNYPFSVTVTDTAGRSATKSYSLNISTPLMFATTSLPSTFKGDTYSTILQNNGGIAPNSYSMDGTLPAGLSFDTTSGVISGIPTTSGLYNISFTISDSAYPTPQTDTKTFQLRVWPSKPYTFTVTLAGSGSGTITSDSGGMACTNGTCYAELPSNTLVNLFASPNNISLFGGWTGDCGGLGDCSFNLIADKAVTATFTAAPNAKVGTKDYPSLQAAYDDSTTNTGSIIRMLGSKTGSFIGNKDIAVVIEGGYNATYDAISTETSIQSPVLIRLGTVRVKGITIP